MIFVREILVGFATFFATKKELMFSFTIIHEFVARKAQDRRCVLTWQANQTQQR